MGTNNGGVYLTNPFERLRAHERPQYVVEPLSIAWNAVVFQVSGARQAVVCVPRDELQDFLDRLDAGELDDSISEFLHEPPANRILRASKQADTTGLFDELAAPDAAVPSERTPGRTRGRGGRGGTPRDARRHKGRRRRRPLRAVVGAVVVAGLIAGGVAVALTLTRSNDKSATKTPATAPNTPDGIAATSLEGTWTVTRTVSQSDSPLQPAGQVSVVTYTVTKDCSASPCTLHLDAPGSFGAVEQADLTFVTDHFEGPITGDSPCLDESGAPNGFAATITGTVALIPATAPATQFTGSLQLALQSGVGCEDADRSILFTLAGAKA